MTSFCGYLTLIFASLVLLGGIWMYRSISNPQGIFGAPVLQVPPLLVTASHVEAFKGKDYNHSILIIGAGAAGMHAAYTLEYLGIHDYQILEAYHDFGGRIRQMTDFIDDFPLDSYGTGMDSYATSDPPRHVVVARC